VRRLSRHRSLRCLAGALATLALVGQLASFAHLVLVRHVTCAEHGELIEVGHERALAVATAHADSPGIATAATGQAHGHDHCLLAPMRRDRVALGAPHALDCAHVDAFGTIGRVGARLIPPPIAVILLAPKSSPPLV
jgi:hypothetical protein